MSLPAEIAPSDHRSPPLLGLSDCTFVLHRSGGESLRVDVEIGSGELVLLQVDDGQAADALAQAFCGLLPPVNGTVRFRDLDWKSLPADRANALRGRIGIVFRQDNWVPYRNMMENLMLAQLHHTRRPFDAIRREAAAWTARFGLPGLPMELPDALSAQDRLRANFARAFMGTPSLILIEEHADAVLRELRPVLVNAIREARERGGAVIWFTRDRALGSDATLPASQRLRVDHGVLRRLETVR